MPQIRDLVVDGQPARGYEVAFEVESEPSSAYVLANGLHVRVQNKVLRMYVLVDANDEPLVTDAGEPRLVVESAATVAAGIRQTAGDTDNTEGIPRAELDALTDEMIRDNAWLLDELSKR